MNVYEESRYPFLHEEDQFITRLIIEEIPFLGICLGAQILAKACGAKVFKAPAEEIGWDAVMVTEQGRKDRLFLHVPETMTVFQWHGDTFDVPAGGYLLAEGKVCPSQAFRVGANAYGLQFHIEATPDMVKRWMENERGRVNVNRIMKQTGKGAESFQKQGSQVLDNFKRIIESSVRIRRVIGMFVEDEKARQARRPIAWWQREELGGLKLLASSG
jgi:GMP synthase-like glutamine amidotransferase